MRLSVLLLLLTSPVMAFAQVPTEQQIEWLKKTAIPLKTETAESGFEDLAPLKEIIGDARIVSLGESTHGSREIFQMKHRLAEFLASELGFTIFSIEASMPESYRVNDFVRTGEGDLKKLIGGMYFWTWNTEEVRDMVQWMHKFNRSKKGRIDFTGFDMQTPDVAMQIAVEYLTKADPQYAATVRKKYAAALKSRRGAFRGGGFGVATGTFPVEQARGKTVTYSGWIKTENVTSWAGLWWRVDGKDRKSLGFDNMAKTGPKGDTEWQRYSIELKIPKEAVNINFGVIMPGQGKAWFDGLEIKLDDRVYEDPQAMDLDFEGDEIKGFAPIHPPGYRRSIDKQVAKTGKQSLRLESVRAPALPAETTDAKAAAALATEVWDTMKKNRESYLEKTSEKDFAWGLQNARVVVQCMNLRARLPGSLRDQSMAENVAWILKQNPKAKIVLWAHNGHVAKQFGAMGRFLDEKFGKEHLAIAFATAKGEYRAIGNGGLKTHPLAEPPQGSVESYLATAGEKRFFLDLRKVRADTPESAFLSQPRPFRMIGALAMERQFFPRNLPRLYDGVVYLETTHAAVGLR